VENPPATLTPSTTSSGAQKFKTIAESNNKNGGQKTKWFKSENKPLLFESCLGVFGGTELETIMDSFKNNFHP
jgi:hypothetical protein